MDVVTAQTISVEVDGTTYEREVEARKLLVHFLRDDLDLTGTHIGCDTGNCGACSLILDGTLVKSCMLLAIHEHHALQCGYCTPGMLMSATALLRASPRPSDDEIAKALQGNICRCTGYWNIFKAVKAASGQEVAE